MKDKQAKINLLLVASLIFYAFWNIPFVFLLIGSFSLDYYLGIKLNGSNNVRIRKIILIVSLLSNLGTLFFFKYFGFFISTTAGIINYFGGYFTPPLIEVVLPVGISFYIFHNLSYIIDIYYNKIPAERNYLRYATFVSFFPQLVAGPILRASHFLPQFNKTRTFSWQIFYQGFFLISLGMFLKVVVADNLAPYVERVYDNSLQVTARSAWLATYAYSIQIFCDFSGYSNIAIGLALLFGYHIPDNFNSPYASVSFSDFWRRWHISLSTWLRDYLYIPLGGNKKGERRTYINLALTMLLGGLWHGAAWNFVAWGAAHGFYLGVERKFKLNKINSHNLLGLVFRRLIIFHLVCLTWVLFRASFTRAGNLLQSMVGLNENGFDVLGLLPSCSIVAILLITLFLQNYFANLNIIDFATTHKVNSFAFVLITSFMWICIIILTGNSNAFIYFQF